MSDDDRPIDAGHLPGRASKAVRVPGLSRILRAADQRRRRRELQGLVGASGWLRLEVLGFVVMVMASMALIHLLFRRPIPQYIPGLAAIFGGLMLIIGAVRIGRPVMFWEGALAGASYIAMGLVLSEYASLAPWWTFALFCLLLLVSALLRGWVALTERREDDGTAWLFASGAEAFFGLCWLVVMRSTGIGFNADLVLSVDLMMLGLAFLSLGTARRTTGSP